MGGAYRADLASLPMTVRIQAVQRLLVTQASLIEAHA
jgi:hypothetical protein